jgi:hypothetical protein
LILLTAYVGFETETKTSKLKTTTAFQNRFKRRQEERESKMSTVTTTTRRQKRRKKRAMAMNTRAMAYFSKRSTATAQSAESG